MKIKQDISFLILDKGSSGGFDMVRGFFAWTLLWREIYILKLLSAPHKLLFVK